MCGGFGVTWFSHVIKLLAFRVYLSRLLKSLFFIGYFTVEPCICFPSFFPSILSGGVSMVDYGVPSLLGDIKNTPNY